MFHVWISLYHLASATFKPPKLTYHEDSRWFPWSRIDDMVTGWAASVLLYLKQVAYTSRKPFSNLASYSADIGS